MLPQEKELDELLACKKEEWKTLQALRAQLQETALQDAQRQLQEAKEKLSQLKKDFTYNLQVLEERDCELERYDAAFAQTSMLEEARKAEVSELKIEVAKLKQAVAKETRKREELQQLYQHRLQEHRLELEQIHSNKNCEIDHHREQYEKLKWQLERKLQELDGELALQKQELLAEFESELKKREHEFRLQADDMSNIVLTHELKVKLLAKELEALKVAGIKAAESLLVAETTNLELEKEVKRKDLEIKDLTAVKNARIKDLEDKLQSVQLIRKKEEEIFKRKHEELDRFAREKDAVLTAVKEANVEHVQKLEAKVLEHQASHDTLEMELRQAEWRQADALKEKDIVIAKLQEDVAAMKSAWDAQIAQISKETISRDLQIHTLQEEEVKLKAQLARFQQDIERYKQQLSLAMKREQILERDKVQVELDWQCRCENAERNQYEKSEDLIQGLTTARNQVAAQLQETEQKLCEMKTVLKAIIFERDQAIHTLSLHGLLPEKEKKVFLTDHKINGSKGFPSSEIQKLQEQNTNLRTAIAHMRREMEALNDQVPSFISTGKKTLNAAVACDPEATSDTLISSSLLADKVSIGMALKKLQAKAVLLDSMVTQLKQKVQQKPLDFDEFQAQLSSQLDEVHLEISGLQEQVTQLKMHFSTVKKEAGKTSNKNQQQIPESLMLGKESQMTKKPLEGTTDRKDRFDQMGAGIQAQPLGAFSMQMLQKKLKEAARKISSLSQEKQQLIEMGNRLRAELGKTKGHSMKFSQHPFQSISGTLYPKTLVRDTGHHFLALEQPQGRLTTQELQYAQQDYFSRFSENAPETLTRNDTPSNFEEEPKLPPAQIQLNTPTRINKLAQEKENRSPEPTEAQELHEENRQLTQRSSSQVGSSLQDIWKMLDLGSSPSGFTSQDDSLPAHRQRLPQKSLKIILRRMEELFSRAQH
ncbi:coiled-coil domain-containing protein 57 isoform X5 [Monodelphis domestica]|uniref:coiled-coil domain-containing protein 57 isoform X5 n=1 Tax=Monodelphis domestica TaxID=13616 RepID=UPI0024E1EF10|nr:coiled-coil domain-containing protein 57 isoform X5 [Monodelphis domestica]XP_056673268.1 coiled-coil domain-containing protein 57 isoform X5 [Monodelphis domestica]